MNMTITPQIASFAEAARDAAGLPKDEPAESGMFAPGSRHG